jgi:uncharacterized protein (TIGR02453 family)
MATRTVPDPARFTGFPPDVYEFWDGLDEDNSKEWFHAHRDLFLTAVKHPMESLLHELQAEFGPAHIFRLNRDIRFANDKRPYKDHQGAYTQGPSGQAARYLHIGGAGLFVGVGYYEMGPDQLVRFRTAVADDATGAELVQLLATASKAGLEQGEPDLVRVPRPWAADHPREALLRHKRMTLHRDFGQPAWLHRRDALTKVRDAWRAGAPLCTWLERNVGPSASPRR